MRRIILLLLTLTLAVLPALAENALAFSADVQLLYKANAALYERYALTVHCLGLFDMQVTRCGDASFVHYTSRGLPHPALTGEYLVLVTPDGTQTFWSHDDVDPAVWQSGELNSIAWGAPQLTIFLQTDSFAREFLDDPYEPDPLAEWMTLEEHNQSTRVYSLRRGTLSPEEIQDADAAGRAALQLMYGLSETSAAEMHLIDATRLAYAEGTSSWLLSFYHNTEPDEINYNVTLGTDLTTVLEISCMTGGIG